MNAVINNNLDVCGDFPSIRNYESVRILGMRGFLSRIIYRLLNKNQVFPFVLNGRKIKLVSHVRLQPGSYIQNIFRDIDYIHKKNGVCVISTHSYGFNYKMEKYNKTMGKTLREIIDYTESLGKVKFVNIGEIFE